MIKKIVTAKSLTNPKQYLKFSVPLDESTQDICQGISEIWIDTYGEPKDDDVHVTIDSPDIDLDSVMVKHQ